MTREEAEWYERTSMNQLSVLIQSLDTAATAVQSAMETLSEAMHSVHVLVHAFVDGDGNGSGQQHSPIIMVQRHDEDEEEME